jgi:hypothetical protein
MSDRIYPILNDKFINGIPWEVIAPHEQQAKRNHSQTLSGLAGRGGLSACEAVAILLDQPWRKLNPWFARAKLISIVWQFEKAKADEAVRAAS